MDRIRRFLGFLATVAFIAFSGHAVAAGYSCPDIKMYTSCNSGYYLSECDDLYAPSAWDGQVLSDSQLGVGNSCNSCPSGYACSGAKTCPVPDIVCKAGTYLSSGACEDCDAGLTSPDGATSEHQCSRACATTDVANSTTVSGTYYQDTGAADCKATACSSNYYVNNGACAKKGTCTVNASKCSGDRCEYAEGVLCAGASCDCAVTATYYTCDKKTSDCPTGATCTWNTDAEYTTDGTACPITNISCGKNSYLDNGTCAACDAGLSAPAGSTTEHACSRACATTDVANSTTVSGAYYQDTGAADCKATTCSSNYYVNNGACAKKGTCTVNTSKCSGDRCEYAEGVLCTGASCDCAVTATYYTCDKKTSDCPTGATCTWNTGAEYTTDGAACPITSWKCNDGFVENEAGTGCKADGYLIEYELYNGTASASGMPGAYTYGKGATVNGVPTLAQNVFLGWCTNADRTQGCAMTQTISATATGNKKFYAKWQPCTACAATNADCELSVVNNECKYTNTCWIGHGNMTNADRYDAACSVLSYTISYELGGGTKSASGMPTSYTYGKGATVNGVPTLTNNEFAGWCTDEAKQNCSMTQTVSTTATGDKKFWADWNKCDACATTNASCSLSVKNNRCTYTTSCDVGYVYIDDNQAGKYNATCELATYTLTYHDGLGGATVKTQDVKYNQSFTPLAANTFTNPAYSFANWMDNGGRTYFAGQSATYTINDDSDVYATWEKCAASSVAGQCNCPTNTRPDGNGKCTSCSVSCANVTGFTQGSYNECNGENNFLCYRDCTTADIANSQTVTGTVTKNNFNTCEVTQCADNYYVFIGSNGRTSCKACPADSVDCGTSSNPDDFECADGHNKVDGECVPIEYTITLKKNGGTGTLNGVAGTADATVTCKHGRPCALIVTGSITRENWGFGGWGTSSTCVSGADSMTFTSDATVYACWSQNMISCQAGKYYDGKGHKECTSGYYCAGTGQVAEGSTGCRTPCTSLGAEYTTSDAGATTPQQCIKPCAAACTESDTWPANASCATSLKCVYDTTKTVTGMQYYGNTECIATAEVTTCPIQKLYCSASYYQSEMTDANGYTTQFCDSCKTLPGFENTFDLSLGTNTGGPSVCYKQCSVNCTLYCPEHANCTYKNTNAFTGKFIYPNYTDCVKTDVFGNATPVGGNCPIAKLNCATGYHSTGNADAYAEGDTCEPDVYTVTLDNNEGTGGNGAIYLKYTLGWYSNEAATSQIGRVTVPTRENYVFLGYFLTKTGGTAQISSDGTINMGYTAVTANTTLYAHWAKGTKQCVVGQYYDGTSMVACPDGQYCPGEGVVEIGTAGCSQPCPAGATGSNDDASNKGHCYAACPTPATIENGTLANYNVTVYYDVTSETYPTATKCLYTATCKNSDYIAQGSPGTAPWCKYSPDVCPENYYCNPDPEKCPDGGLSNAGDVLITDCYKIFNNYEGFKYGTADAKCTYNADDEDYTNCSVIQPAHTCIAGYHHKVTASFACDPVENGHWSPEGLIVQKTCPTGGDGSTELADNYDDCYKWCTLTVDNSISVSPKEDRVYGKSETEYNACSFDVVCAKGYTVKNNNTANPTCEANWYTVNLNKNGGAGNVAESIKCEFNSKKCELPSYSMLTRAGYNASAAKWCEGADGSGKCYGAGANTVENISADGTAATLYAIWTPNVYKVVFNGNGATTAGTPSEVWLKYATGWYSNSSATTAVGNVATMPTKSGYVFAGYYTAKTGGAQVVDAQGAFQTTDDALQMTTTDGATVYARWSADYTTCAEKTYYTGTATSCAPCTENHWCPGGRFATDSGQIEGRNACNDGGMSPEGSSKASDCYKTGLQYNATYGSGTQTCYYDANATSYSLNCKDEKINSCVGGYYLAADTDVDCSVVGTGNYSGDGEIGLHTCPNGGTTTGTTTVQVQDCIKTGLPYAATFGNGTQTCKYSDGEGNNARYERDCFDKEILTCRGGYYLAADTDVDCSEAGENHYSNINWTKREPCPDGGQTSTTTTVEASGCFIADIPYTADHGSGYRVCYYNTETGKYTYSCETPTITKCMGGYYAPNPNVYDCSKVGIGYFSPEGPVSREQCPVGTTTEGDKYGTTLTDTSTSKSACYLEKLPCSISSGSGENKCNYGTNAYDLDCTSCLVTGCMDGYSQVGNDCIICPADNICTDGEQNTCVALTGGTHPNADAGTTDVNLCYKTCAVADNAAAMSGRDYYGATDTCAIAMCNSGYYLDGGVCKPCEAGSICPTPTPENPNPKPQTCTTLTGGTHTMSDAGETDVNLCYKACELAPNATAMIGRDYYGAPDTCEIATCEPTYYLGNGQCHSCPEGMVCVPPTEDNPNPQPQTCASLTGNKYTMSDAGTTNVNMCYRACDNAPNAAAMSGRDYYNAPDTCVVTMCEETFYLSNGKCVQCPEGSICIPPTEENPNPRPQTCASLTDGKYPLSAPGSTDKSQCYHVCESYDIVYGTALPTTDKAFWPNECEFTCKSVTGNAGDIKDNVCVESKCNSNYEMIAGRCVLCNREHAVSYALAGNCVVETCVSGYHPDGDKCVADTITCAAPNAVRAEQVWDDKRGAFGVCLVKECESGYHIESNACVSNIQPCELENGTGEHEWNPNKKAWGECIATHCDAGYTSDRTEMDAREGVKQCGRCRNAFGVNGELAVDRYREGCEIASCMYQGQLYDLQNNECVPICEVNGYEDETGYRRWNPRTKRCEIECNSGYRMW